MVNVISHRGANTFAPQNTLPAFQKSFSISVDGIETDIHVTKDGVPVVCHNYTIDETSTGVGEICDLTLEELRSYDFGSYFDKEFEGTKIPTLDELLDLCATANLTVLNIELKSPRNKDSDIVKKTIDAVKAHGLFDVLLISSFDSELLIEAKQIDPACKTAYLYAPTMLKSIHKWFNAVKFAKKINCDALHPHYSFVTKHYVKASHKAGIRVNPWTVNSPEVMLQMISCGVDGLITDRPDIANSLLGKKTK